MMNHKDLYLNKQTSTQVARFSKDGDKWMNSKTD